MSTPQVLFVETQGQILERMMRNLAQSRADWEVLRVNDPQTALETISHRGINVLVASFGTDQRGCEDLFRAVSDRAPAIIRVGLMPDQQKSNCILSLDHAHQCLAEHIDPGQIEAAIARGLTMWSRADENPNLARFLSDLHTLPTPPALYFEIRDELESPNGSLHGVARSIARDPALTAKVLKVVNSGFYALPRSIANLPQAVTLLGSDTVLALVLAAHLFDQLPLPGLNLDTLWKHCATVATLAKEIAAEEGGDRQAITCSGVAGILHDIGVLILLANVPDRYFAMVRQAGGDEAALLRMERERFGLGHPELGAYVLGLWGLPEDVVNAVALHHSWNDGAVTVASLPSKAVFAAEWLLQVSFEREDAQALGTEPEEGWEPAPSATEGWRKLFDRLTERGLFQ